MTDGNGNGRDRDTEPAPADSGARLGKQLAELEIAIYRVGELLSGLQHTVSLLRLAQGTEEHRLNRIQDAASVHGEQLEDHEARLQRLEAPTTAAE
jgi:hypothetical protein